MPSKIHEDADPVFPNPMHEHLIRHSDTIDPVVSVSPKPFGDFINLGMVVVAEDFEVIVLMVLQDRLDEIGNRVLAEIRRDIADSKPPSEILVIPVGLNVCRQGKSVLLTELEVRSKNNLITYAICVIE